MKNTVADTKDASAWPNIAVSVLSYSFRDGSPRFMVRKVGVILSDH